MRIFTFECSNDACALRFPATELDRTVRSCPRCGGQVQMVHEGETAGEQPGPRSVLPLELLIDNVRSAFNVGSMLRSADAAGVRRVTLCGITPTPEQPRVARSALGAEQVVPWRYAANAVRAAEGLRAEGVTLWVLEEGAASRPLFDVALPSGPLALIVGNEVAGVDPGLLTLADAVVGLPMRGAKRSLNVAVAAGAALVLISQQIAGAESGGQGNDH